MIYFEPIREDEFDEYWKHSVESWMKDMGKAGLIDSSISYEEAEGHVKKFIPEGIHTPGHHFMHIIANGDKIGTLWIEIRTKGTTEAYLWDIFIENGYRGKGYGKDAMVKLDEFVKEKGAIKISLNVFGFNTVARSLYQKMGYQDAAITMLKYF